MDLFKPLPLRDQPCVGFRVECHLNRTLSSFGELIPRGWRLINDSIEQTLDAYLSWKHEPTPFISFFASWERALRWRDWLIQRRGARDVVIIAVWLRGKPEIYDGRAVAAALGYEENRLKYHAEEFILRGGIDAPDNRILAILPGNGPLVKISLSPFPLLPNRKLRATIPEDALPTSGGSNRTEELKNELLHHIGFSNEMFFCALALSLCGQGWELIDDGSKVTFHISNAKWNSHCDFKYWFNARVVGEKDVVDCHKSDASSTPSVKTPHMYGTDEEIRRSPSPIFIGGFVAFA
ncbi:hypothetical protein Hte_008013 [Hypoxylon texense]